MSESREEKRARIEADVDRIREGGWRLFVDDAEVIPLTLDTYMAAIGPQPGRLRQGAFVIKHIRWERDQSSKGDS